MRTNILILIMISIFFISCSNKNDSDLSQSEFVFIKSGIYTIGSPVGEFGRWPKGEEDIRKIKTEGFYISKTEITEKQYYSIINEGINSNQNSCLPVVNVSWLDAIYYCNKRSKNEGLEEVYIYPDKVNITMHEILIDETANGYRLPTIDEWEIACRAKTRRPYYTGTRISKKYANYNSTERIDVGSLKPNKYGLYDMAGNVSEWCWKNDYFTMAKGGSWQSEYMHYLRSSSVIFSDEFTKNDYTGFRVVKNK